MDFRGHLRLPEDAGTGIPVLLRLDDIFVVISSGEDELGTWRADDVVIERIFSNQFSIELDGESMVFIAQDALGFAYDGISAIEDLQERLTKRRVFKRSKKKTKSSEADPAPIPSVAASETPGEAAERDTSQPATAEDVGEEPAPFEPTAIWAPPSSTPASVVPGAEPEDPPSSEDVEIPEPSPDDVRVSYPQPPPPPPAPVVESPPSEPTRVEPAAAEAADDEPPPESPPVEQEPAAAPEPVPVPAEPEEPEYEIEEVSPAATGATWSDDVAVEAEEAEPPIEIEEWVLPAAGAVEMFSTVEPEDDLTEVPQQPPAETDEEPASADVPDVPAAASDPEPEGRHLSVVASDPEQSEQSEQSEHPEESEEPEMLDVESAPSNGHRRKDVSARDRTAEKRERRNLLFGRSRDKKVAPHDHRYGDPKTIGGLTRQVCEVCGHVTFSGEDVYQGW